MGVGWMGTTAEGSMKQMTRIQRTMRYVMRWTIIVGLIAAGLFTVALVVFEVRLWEFIEGVAPFLGVY